MLVALGLQIGREPVLGLVQLNAADALENGLA